MTPEQYKQQMAELGVDRGRLDDSKEFEWEMPTVSKYKDKPTNWRVPRRLPAMPTQDLTHLNPRTSLGKPYAKPMAKEAKV